MHKMGLLGHIVEDNIFSEYRVIVHFYIESIQWKLCRLFIYILNSAHALARKCLNDNEISIKIVLLWYP